MHNRLPLLAGLGILTVLLTAGTAQSLSGSNTVFGDDIVNGTITTPDLKAGSISGSRLLNNGITSSKVYDNTLIGADVNEATLVLTCKSGLTRVGDLCYSPQRGPTAQDVALNDCADERLRIPSLGEARMLALHLGGSPQLWTDGVFFTNSFQGIITDGSSFVFTQSSNLTIPYRCVTTVGARP